MLPPIFPVQKLMLAKFTRPIKFVCLPSKQTAQIYCCDRLLSIAARKLGKSRKNVSKIHWICARSTQIRGQRAKRASTRLLWPNLEPQANGRVSDWLQGHQGHSQMHMHMHTRLSSRLPVRPPASGLAASLGAESSTKLAHIIIKQYAFETFDSVLNGRCRFRRQ